MLMTQYKVRFLEQLQTLQFPGDLVVGGIIDGVLTSNGNNIHVYEYIGTR